MPSILTDAMNRAREIKEAKDNGEDIQTTEEVRAKRILKKVGITLAVTAATAIVVGMVANRADKDETENNDQD